MAPPAAARPPACSCHPLHRTAPHLVLLHPGFAHGAGPAVALHLEPAVEAGPAVEVPAQRHHRLRGELQQQGGRVGRVLSHGARGGGQQRPAKQQHRVIDAPSVLLTS